MATLNRIIMMKKYTNIYILTLTFLFSSMLLKAQESVLIFNDRRVINSHSVEMLKKRQCDVRISHRFGDMFGKAGGWQTLYGLEDAADIGIGVEYGLTNHINFGLIRTKGSGNLKQNIHFFGKARLMSQKLNSRNLFSVTVLGQTSYSTMPKSENKGVLSYFPKQSHRFSYHLQVMLARKFGNRFSLQVNLNYTYRNLVFNYDQNDLTSVGLAAKLQITKVFGLILDGTYTLLDNRENPKPYQFPLSVGFEFETGGGHVFQINLTNARGLSETDYIPYTFSSWQDGEFRLGFTISRKFNI